MNLPTANPRVQIHAAILEALKPYEKPDDVTLFVMKRLQAGPERNNFTNFQTHRAFNIKIVRSAKNRSALRTITERITEMSENQNKIFGDFIEISEGEMKGRLSLSFQAMNLDIDQLWEGSTLSAKFLSTFWGKFFPDHSGVSAHIRKQVADEVHYIAGELLGNAVKFSYEPEYMIEICLYLYEKELRFYITNSLSAESQDKLQRFITRILTEDTSALFLEQIEKSAAGENDESGVGFLTMINDYGIRLSWKFEENTRGVKTVTTLARLPIVRE